MKQTINVYQFRDAFKSMNRGDNFSYEGLTALFNYLEDLETDLDEEIELDVIALCCDYSEISIEHIEQETGCDDLDQLRDHTTVIEVDDETIIFQVF